MKKNEETESSNEEDTYNEYLQNPQKRKQFDIIRLYQQQKELSKMSGYNKQIILDLPTKMNEQGAQKNYATVALCNLSVTNPFRDVIIRIVLNPWFDRVILLVICGNCILLAIDNPNEAQLYYQMVADFLLLSIYTCEMIFKIIAMGFVMRPYTYLRDAWNIMDFVVVMLGWLSKLFTSNNVQAIRVIRILRPLRTINSFRGMRTLVQSLLTSLPSVLNVYILFLFFLVMFGTIGNQLFSGLFNKRCVGIYGQIHWDSDNYESMCRFDTDCVFTDGDSAYQCLTMQNPNYGVTNFDNIFYATLQVFIIITLEGWTEIMYFARKATGTYGYDLYFLATVIVGTFFILNLMVAVQFTYLSEAFNAIEAANNNNKLKYQDDRADQSPSPTLVNEKNKEQIQPEANDFEEAFNQLVQKSGNDNEDDDDDKSNKKLKEDKLSANKLSENAQKEDGSKSEEQNQGPVLEDQRAKSIVQTQSGKTQKYKMFNWYFKSSAWLAKILETRSFNLMIIFFIVSNTVVLSIDHYGESDQTAKTLNIINQTHTCIFAIEMIIKMYGYGIKKYVMDGFNDFDAIIVVVGLLEFFSISSKVVTVIRCFRLLRIFKIVRAWASLKKLLHTMLSAFAIIANLGLLMCLLIFIYALIGMQFLAGSAPEFYSAPLQYSFDSFPWALITVFVLITDENWNSTMTEYVGGNGIWYSLYFVTIILIGSMMLLDLFLAVMLNFIQEEYYEEALNEKNQQENEKELQDEMIEAEMDFLNEKPKYNSQKLQKPEIQSSLFMVHGTQSEQQIASVDRKQEELKNIMVEESEQQKEEINVAQVEEYFGLSPELKLRHNGQQIQSNEEQSKMFEQSMSQQVTNKSQFGSRKIKKSFNVFNIQGRSLFIFKQDNKIRTFLQSILENPYFDNMIYHLIALNTILLALDMPQLSDPYQKNTIKILTNIISGLFIGEALMKIIVQGFVYGKGTYLREPWNILDFLIVLSTITNWILIYFSSVSINYLRALRSLRALRPLRMVSRNEGMRLVVNSLLKSIPTLLNVMLICLLFYLVFGILAVQLFQGAMSHCNDSSINDKNSCQESYYDISSLGFIDRQWITPFKNWDDLGHAMIVWYEVSTFENWPDILFKTINSVGVDKAPSPNNRPWVAIIFIIFIFVTNFFVTNLFVSVIVDRFNEEIKKQQGSHDFTEEQKEWVKMQRIMVNINVKIYRRAPQQRFRRWCYIIVENQKFEYFILFIIMVNTLFLCMTYNNQPPLYNLVLTDGNILFVSIYALEALLKILAYGPKLYWYETWNKFDFVIVLVSLISLDQNLFNFNITALRIIRVARLLRMVKVSKGLRHLLKTLYLSLGNVMNVGALVFLILFTFTIAGMDLFGQMPFTANITVNTNFQTFYLGMMTLVRASTGENWNEFMHDSFPIVGWISVFYWCLFELLLHFVFLNVFVAVIYESFSEIMSSEDKNDILSLKRADIKGFVNTWKQFNNDGSHYMKSKQFPAFLRELPPPLGYGGINIEQSKLLKIIFCLNIRDHQGRVYFPEVMWAIFHSIIGNNDEKVHKCQQVRNIMKAVKRKYTGLPNNTTPDSLCGNRFYRTEMTLSKYLCAIQIVNIWRKSKATRLARLNAAQIEQNGFEKQPTLKGQNLSPSDQNRKESVRNSIVENSQNWEQNFVRKDNTNVNLLDQQNNMSQNDGQLSESYDVNQDYGSNHNSGGEEEEKMQARVDSVEIEVDDTNLKSSPLQKNKKNNIAYEESDESQSSINSEQISSANNSRLNHVHLMYQEKKIFDFSNNKGMSPLKRKPSTLSEKNKHGVGEILGEKTSLHYQKVNNVGKFDSKQKNESVRKISQSVHSFNKKED